MEFVTPVIIIQGPDAKKTASVASGVAARLKSMGIHHMRVQVDQLGPSRTWIQTLAGMWETQRNHNGRAIILNGRDLIPHQSSIDSALATAHIPEEEFYEEYHEADQFCFYAFQHDENADIDDRGFQSADGR